MTTEAELEAMQNEIADLEEKQAMEEKAIKLREKLKQLRPKSLFRRAIEAVGKEINEMVKGEKR